MKIKNKIYVESTKKDVEKLNNRPYRLALDLGVGSIGYAVGAITKNEDNRTFVEDIIISGSRIFQSSKGAAERREKRGQRNSLRHKKNRLTFLWKILAEKELMLPYCKATDELDTSIVRFSERVRTLKNESIYTLRYKGISQKLELDEIGYCIYHIANHRGSSSVRTFLDMNKNEIKELEKIKKQLGKTEELVEKNNNISFIEILFANNCEKFIGYRNTGERTEIPLPTRDVILKELEKLLQKQKIFYPNIFTEEYCKRIIDAVNYENEKIVPEAGNCPYFSNEKKLPKCHFLNEERRLWEAIINARIKIPENEKNTVVYKSNSFSTDEMNTLYNILRSGENLTVKKVKTIFPDYKNFEIHLQGRDSKTSEIKGFRFKSLENKEFWKRLNEEEKDLFLSTWVNCPDDEKLKNILIDKFKLTSMEAKDALKNIQLISDYAPVGKSAMKILLECIEQQRVTWTEAILLCEKEGKLTSIKEEKEYDLLPYYGQVLPDSTVALMGKFWHSSFSVKSKAKGFTKPNTAYEEEKYGKIANPVVHQTLNELRKLINEMITLFGYKPSEIVLEVARNLKVGLEKREEISRNQANAEKERVKYFDTYCKPNNLSPKYIRHFQMMELQGKICPYCCKPINPEMIMKNQTDIDHILPERDTSDSSFNNLVLSHRICNENKGKRTPFQAFYGTEKWKEILHFLDTNSSLRFKRWRFLLSDEEYKNYLERKGFLSRFGTDNAYIAKVAREYLNCLFPVEKQSKHNVHTVKGGETAIFRNAWGLNQIAFELGALHIEEKDAKDFIPKKDRTDHRHHALDAVTMLYATRGYTQLINTLKANNCDISFIEKKIPAPFSPKKLTESVALKEDWGVWNEQFYLNIENHLKNESHVSIKYDTDKNGELVKGTNFAILGIDKENVILCTKKKIATLDKIESLIKPLFKCEEIEKIDESLKNKLLKLQDYNTEKYNKIMVNVEKAKEMIKDENIKNASEGRKVIEENEKNYIFRALQLTGGKYYKLSRQNINKLFVKRIPSEKGKGFAYDTGRNLCLDLYHNNEGKLCGEIIRKIQGMDNEYVPLYKKQGFELLERIYQGDTLEMDYDSENRTYSVFSTVSGSYRVLVRVDTFTEIKNGFQVHVSNIFTSTKGQSASCTLGTMQERHTRKVVLSSLGYPLYVSRLLKDKK